MKVKTVTKFKVQSKTTGWYNTFNTLEEAIEAAKTDWEFKGKPLTFTKVTIKTEPLTVDL